MIRKHKSVKTIALLLTGALLLGGCGADPAAGNKTASKGTDENNSSGTSMGRYVEQKIELPGELGGIYHLSMAQSDDAIRISNGMGNGMVSYDKGMTFQYDDKISQAYLDIMEDDSQYVYSKKISANGACILTTYSYNADGEPEEFPTYKLITADNQVKELEGLPKARVSFYTGEDGNIYGDYYEDDSIYQINMDTGDVTFLFQAESSVGYIAAVGKYLFAATKKGLQIFDLDKKELAENDTVLSDFLKNEKFTFSGNYYFLIFQGKEEDSIYVVTEKGLYKHVMYGSMMEQVIDGSLCSIGYASKSYISMQTIRNVEEECFLLLFADGTLMRFAYDPNVPTVPDKTLRLYSVYEDNNLKRAVSAFQQSHQDLYVTYEVGVTGDNGVTLEDALKNLSTELVAGKGPDILLMDDIPYDSYVEKGVLLDLSDLLSGMQGEEFFDNIIDNFRKDEKLYTIPIAFSMALLSGPEDNIKDVKTLSDLADLMEETRAAQPQGSLFSFFDAQSLLALMSQSSSGTWVKEDGSLNREAVTEYLIQCKRIYDTQISSINDEIKEDMQNSSFGLSGSNSRGMVRYGLADATAAVSSAFYLKQPYSAGFFSGALEELSFYTSMLRAQQNIYVPLPGQIQQACIPATLVSINQATAIMDDAQEFVRFILSEEFETNAYISGVPINKSSYQAKAKDIIGEDTDEPFGVVSMNDNEGNIIDIDVYSPNAGEVERLNQIIEEITQVCRCDERVYQAVIELGKAAMTGESGIEEAVDAIEKKVQLYLAE